MDHFWLMLLETKYIKPLYVGPLEDTVDHFWLMYQETEYIKPLYVGPLEDTVDHFWLMCQETKSNCIVMLCRCYENSR